MTVTFNRPDLIKVARRALAAHDQAIGDQQAAVVRWKAERAAKHATEHRDSQRRLRDALTVSLRNGKLLTRKEARKAAGGVNSLDYLFYDAPGEYETSRDGPKTPAVLTPAEISETRALITVLEAANGDTITANELKLLGLKNLAPVFIAAANEPATPPKQSR
jgi:regulator of protease activity HflC (stomatin/prohibitin superfamily)